MVTGQRNRILAVDDVEDNLDDIEWEVGELSKDVTVRRETTGEGAIKAITEEAAAFLAVVTDYSLTGSVGNEGLEIAEEAVKAGIPNVAIRTANSGVRPPAGASLWDKEDKLKDRLRPFLAT